MVEGWESSGLGTYQQVMIGYPVSHHMSGLTDKEQNKEDFVRVVDPQLGLSQYVLDFVIFPALAPTVISQNECFLHCRAQITSHALIRKSNSFD